MEFLSVFKAFLRGVRVVGGVTKYIHMYACVCIYIYIYVCIYTYKLKLRLTCNGSA